MTSAPLTELDSTALRGFLKATAAERQQALDQLQAVEHFLTTPGSALPTEAMPARPSGPSQSFWQRPGRPAAEAASPSPTSSPMASRAQALVDQLIERRLDRLRQELRQQLGAEMRRWLRDAHLPTPR